MARYETVLFDLDGTLIDSGPMIFASFRHAVRTVAGREVTDDELRSFVGGWSLQRQMQEIDPERADELVAVYREHNVPAHEGLEAFPGIVDVLDALRGDGRSLGLVTAKRRLTVELAFEHVPIAHYFEAIVSADETKEHKPSPEPLLYALARLEAAAETAVYVGDSPFDVAAARAAGMNAIAVTWGGMYTEARLRAEEPHHVARTREELLALVS